MLRIARVLFCINITLSTTERQLRLIKVETPITEQEKEKARQKAIAKARLEAAKKRRKENLEVIEEKPSNFEDEITFTFAKFNNQEIDQLAKVAESGEYKKYLSHEKTQLVDEIQKCEDLEKAISYRLAYIALTEPSKFDFSSDLRLV